MKHAIKSKEPLASIDDFCLAFPLKYCAHRYLLQWLGKEDALIDSMSHRASTVHLKTALGYFKIARSFKGIGANERKIKKICKLFENCRNSNFPSADERVEKLANQFKQEVGSKNISAASKLLWLSNPENYVIYDRRAAIALFRLAKFKINSYTDYAKTWRSQYELAEPKINMAVKNIKAWKYLIPAYEYEFAHLERICREKWFKQRVFDMLLWESAYLVR